jgi:hypothetical protein
MITQERLKQVLHYAPDTGVFTWKVGKRGCSAGSVAGHVCKRDKYRLIGVDTKLYFAHRLVWLYMYGSFPKNQIDHINRNRSDNRLSNLRDATNAQNSQNASLRKDSTSKVRGVHWYKRRSKWQVYINVNGRRSFIGYFSDKSDAVAAYSAAARERHPFNQELHQ